MKALFEKYQYFYFIGVGGIGMSAIARYINAHNVKVAGYDKVSSALTETLVAEGIAVHYDDDPQHIPLEFKYNNNKYKTLVVYTPAIPSSNKEMQYFKNNGYSIVKRAKVLGMITDELDAIAVAGSHGKTTVSTMIAHVLNGTHEGCNAFLGGIAKNYDSNLLLSDKSDKVVVEADEYDRSFHHIHPEYAVITAVDSDHLDIYGSKDEIDRSFNHFVNNIVDGGTLLYKRNIDKEIVQNASIKTFTYSLDDSRADYYAENIIISDGFYYFDICTPGETIKHVKLGVPGLLNVENALAAAGITDLIGVERSIIKKALCTAQGVRRRLDFHLRSNNLVYIDDYAHHPEEIRYCIRSVQEMFPGKKITGIFQPHLYSRTRDFADAFAESLNMLDELIMLDIYPAREEPIEGVDAKIILDQVKLKKKQLCEKKELKEVLRHKEPEVLLTLGAGDIDRLVPEIKNILLYNVKHK